MAREKAKPLPSKITRRQHKALCWIARYYSFKSGWCRRVKGGYTFDYGALENTTHYMIGGYLTGPSDDYRVKFRENGRSIYIAERDWKVVRLFLDPGALWRPRLINLSPEGMRWVADGPFCVFPRKRGRRVEYEPHGIEQTQLSNADPIFDAA